jgi:hypothetical protein
MTPVTTALAVLDMAQAGRFADVRDLFAAPLRPMVTADALRIAWDTELGQRGPVVSLGTPVSEPASAGVVVVKVPVACERGGFSLLVSVTGEGSLTGLQLAPTVAAEPVAPWEPPAYADPSTFDEQDTTVGLGSQAVPGTLSIPHQSGPLPAVVLLGGSGPVDRDLTIARSKPFKDLAWGLASRGVAVLRFDKVTYAHPDEVVRDPDFTVADEYLPHALAAIRLLREHPAVDPERIFLVGHSLGGTVAPRVAAADPSTAGLVILAGGAQPLHWATVRQIRYIASLDPATAAAAQPAIDTLTEQARRIDDPDLSPATPAGDLLFGTPAPYWLDLRGYDPVATAVALDKPMLVLQGGRDYQATVADDLSLWEAGLAHRPGVTIRVYPPDNHFFFPGTGPSSPAEIEPAQHVDPAVVADIASWLLVRDR